MKQGSLEWFRAKYVAMLIAHISLCESSDSPLNEAESAADEKSTREEWSEDHAS